MQVDNNIQNPSVPPQSESSPNKEHDGQEGKNVKAENRIARYEQKPERKASKMLVRLLQWADKLVIKFFTKKMLPQELEIFFNREARANKVQLKKAQIDYSVQDFAVRLYVFWVCQYYFEKTSYESNLQKLLIELRDELTRKKKNLSQSLLACEQQTQKKQKEEELKWMQAIINGLTVFIKKYVQLGSQQDVLEFLLEVTSNIMIDCLRKPGNKLAKKKEKLKVKIKYFQQKIASITGNFQQRSVQPEIQKKVNKIIQKNTIIIQAENYPFAGLTRTLSNTSAFQKYRAEDYEKQEQQNVNKQFIDEQSESQKKLKKFMRPQNLFGNRDSNIIKQKSKHLSFHLSTTQIKQEQLLQ